MICPVCGWAVGHDPMSFCGWRFAPGPKEKYDAGRQETSQQAWEDIQDELPAAREAALKLLLSAGGYGVTGGEANRNLSKGEGNPSYHRRLSELVDLGYAFRSHKRACTISGKMAWVYVVSPKGLALSKRGTK